MQALDALAFFSRNWRGVLAVKGKDVHYAIFYALSTPGASFLINREIHAAPFHVSHG
jgi:hypothetical protein